MPVPVPATASSVRWPGGRRAGSMSAARCRPEARATAAEALGGSYEIVGNGVELDRFASAEPWPTDGPTVLFVGRHERRKGLGVLLDAFGRSRRRRRRHLVGGRSRAPRRRPPAGPHTGRRPRGVAGACRRRRVGVPAARRPRPVRPVARRRVLRHGPPRGHGGPDRRGGERHPGISHSSPAATPCSSLPATPTPWPGRWPRRWPTPPPAPGVVPRPPSIAAFAHASTWSMARLARALRGDLRRPRCRCGAGRLGRTPTLPPMSGSSGSGPRFVLGPPPRRPPRRRESTRRWVGGPRSGGVGQAVRWRDGQRPVGGGRGGARAAAVAVAARGGPGGARGGGRSGGARGGGPRWRRA